jgi:hypothetical protein
MTKKKMAHVARLGRLASHIYSQQPTTTQVVAAAAASQQQVFEQQTAGSKGPTRHNRVEMFEQGYTIVDDMVDEEMLGRLIEAADRIYAECAANPGTRDLNGGLVLRDNPEHGPHAIRGLMAPGMRAPVFAEYMGSKAVLDYTRGWIGAEKEDLMMPDADCILYCSPMNADRAQGWHRDFGHWKGDADHTSGSGYTEAAQRERWAALTSPDYWPTPFDPDVPESGGLFGHNTYIEHNPGAQVLTAPIKFVCSPTLLVVLLRCSQHLIVADWAAVGAVGARAVRPRDQLRRRVRARKPQALPQRVRERRAGAGEGEGGHAGFRARAAGWRRVGWHVGRPRRRE